MQTSNQDKDVYFIIYRDKHKNYRINKYYINKICFNYSFKIFNLKNLKIISNFIKNINSKCFKNCKVNKLTRKML